MTYGQAESWGIFLPFGVGIRLLGYGFGFKADNCATKLRFLPQGLDIGPEAKVWSTMPRFWPPG